MHHEEKRGDPDWRGVEGAWCLDIRESAHDP